MIEFLIQLKTFILLMTIVKINNEETKGNTKQDRQSCKDNQTNIKNVIYSIRRKNNINNKH